MIKKDIKNGLDNYKLELLDLLVPTEIEDIGNLQLPTPSLLSYYKERQNRTIWLTKDIDETLFDEAKLIVQWNREDEQNNIPIEKRKPIKILIHSFGGDMYSCYSFIDCMNLSNTKIICINMACAMSAGAIIFINGHERYCMPNSTALLHNGSSASAGDYAAIQEQNKNYKKMVSRMYDIICSKTKITKAQLTRKLKTDWYISAEEQVEYGLCSSIVNNINQII